MRGWVWVILSLAAGCHDTSSPSGAPSAPLADGSTVQVTEVVKGDEVWVRHGDEKARVRLTGVYAFRSDGRSPREPELAGRAQARLAELLAGRTVTLRHEPTTRDVMARYLVYLERDGSDVGKTLIEEGVALCYDEFPFARERDYLAAEANARTAKRGLWADTAVAATADALHARWRAARASRKSASEQQ